MEWGKGAIAGDEPVDGKEWQLGLAPKMRSASSRAR